MCSIDNNKPDIDELFEDLVHPNPNIKRKAYLDLVKYWPEESFPRLMANLGANDIDLRRTSVKALGAFGSRSFSPLVEIFNLSESRTVRTSCLKALLHIAVSSPGQRFPSDVMKVIESALHDSAGELTLIAISILRQICNQGLPLLLLSSRSENLLVASAAATALGEFNNPKAEDCLRELLLDESLDSILRESVVNALANFKKVSQ